MQKVQSVIYVMNQRIKSDPTLRSSTDPLVICFSDDDLSFGQLTGKPSWSCTYRTSYDSLFDTTATIKRINSKGVIFNGQITGFTESVCCTNKFYHFMVSASAQYTESLFLFKRPNSDNIYISYNGQIRKLLLENNGSDFNRLLSSFIALSVGDRIVMEPMCYIEAGKIVQMWPERVGNICSFHYKIQSAKNVFYSLTYHQMSLVHFLYFRGYFETISEIVIFLTERHYIAVPTHLLC